MSLSSLLIIFSSSFMALFPVINPLGNGFVVNGFFANLDPSQRKTAIQKLTINFIMIGVGTLLIGHLFLLIFGLAIPVIQLGGASSRRYFIPSRFLSVSVRAVYP